MYSGMDKKSCGLWRGAIADNSTIKVNFYYITNANLSPMDTMRIYEESVFRVWV
tara:strand:+ start:312 stop:473 length:162 start_codon:yes stop_codon:yes gene_type:complete